MELNNLMLRIWVIWVICLAPTSWLLLRTKLEHGAELVDITYIPRSWAGNRYQRCAQRKDASLAWCQPSWYEFRNPQTRQRVDCGLRELPICWCCKRQQATLCAFPGDFTCPFVSTGVRGSACDAQQGGRSPKLQVLSIHSLSFLKPNLFYDLCPFKIRINDLSFYPYAFEDRSQGWKWHQRSFGGWWTRPDFYLTPWFESLWKQPLPSLPLNGQSLSW